MKIPTKDTEGQPNGYVQPLWSALENPELRPEQVYVTAIAPHSRKGPHLHKVRRGLFAAASGKVRFRFLVLGHYVDCVLSPEMQTPQNILVTPGTPCAMYNYGDTEALVVNMPSPAWSADEPDEHPVPDWKDPDDWPPCRDAVVSCASCGHLLADHDSGGCCRASFCNCQEPK